MSPMKPMYNACVGIQDMYMDRTGKEGSRGARETGGEQEQGWAEWGGEERAINSSEAWAGRGVDAKEEDL